MRNQKGYLLALTTGFILIFTIFGLSSIYISGLQNQTAERDISGIRAFWLAEAGIQKGLWKLNNNESNWSTDEWETIASGYESKNPLSLGGEGNYEIQIVYLGSNNPVIRSYGYIPFVGDTPDKDSPNYTKRIIEVTLYKNTFNYGNAGKEYIIMGGGASTDSYNSNYGYDPNNPGDNGDIATNGDVTINGSEVQINGDVIYGPDGEIIFNGEGTGENQISGDPIQNEFKIPFPPVEVPETLLNLEDEGTLTESPVIPITGEHKFTEIKLSLNDVLTIIGPAQIYVTGTRTEPPNKSITVTGEAKIIIDESSTGPVEIYADGSVSVAGSGIVNETMNPGSLLIFGSGPVYEKEPGITISISGSSDFYGAVYAPEADVAVTGNTEDVYGALIGRTIDNAGGSSMHYDENLSNLQLSDEKYTSQNWQEIF